jgi:hypothetical protein
MARTGTTVSRPVFVSKLGLRASNMASTFPDTSCPTYWQLSRLTGRTLARLARKGRMRYSRKDAAMSDAIDDWSERQEGDKAAAITFRMKKATESRVH